MWPRLRKQNYHKFLDRRALYKDLIILKQVLPNKIALNKDLNCKLPCIIERYKQASFDIV